MYSPSVSLQIWSLLTRLHPKVAQIRLLASPRLVCLTVVTREPFKEFSWRLIFWSSKYVLPLQFRIRSHDDNINNNNHVHFASRPTRVSISTDLDGNSLQCPDTVVATVWHRHIHLLAIRQRWSVAAPCSNLLRLMRSNPVVTQMSSAVGTAGASCVRQCCVRPPVNTVRNSADVRTEWNQNE